MKAILKKLVKDVWRCEKFLFLLYIKHWLEINRYREQFQLLRPDTEVFIISFPKSGRTWHHMLMRSYLAKLENRSIDEISSIEWRANKITGPRISYNHNFANFRDAIPGSHPIVASSDLWVGRKVIFIVREPKDILVSAWFHAHYQDPVYSGSIQEFIRSPAAGIEKILSAHNRWWSNRNRAMAHMVTSYERMTHDSGKVLRETLEFLKYWPINEVILAEAVKLASFASMKNLEKEGLLHGANRRSIPGEENAFRVRVGKIGSYREHLTADDIAYVDSEIRRIGDPFQEYYAVS